MQKALRWADRPWFWAVAGGFLWLVRYCAFARPGRPAVPWIGWFDQGQYLRSATAFAHLDLTASAHWYPLAYPLLASPFVWIWPRDPFLPLDLALFAATLLGFQRAMRVLGISPVASGLAFLATALAQGKVARLWTVPWTTTLSAALIWWALALAAAILAAPSREAPSPRRLLAIGLLCGSLPAARPVDLLFGAIIGPALLATMLARGQASWRRLAALAGGMVAPLPLYLLLHCAIYGLQPSAYMTASAAIGFVFADIGWKAYVLLVTPAPWFPDCRSIMEALPWVGPGIAGLVAGAATRAPGTGSAWALMLAAALAYAMMLLAYVDLQPPGLWHYNNAHYFKWLFPLAGVGLVLIGEAWRARRGRIASGAALVALGLLLCLRITPRPVADDQPARMLIFPATPTATWDESYFAPAIVADRVGELRNVGNFHQIPDGDRVRALAIVRPFAGRPLLIEPGHAPLAPLARYGERVSVGLPCWIARAACAMP